ncbi:MAG: transcription antitermination factor NusB [Actinomycetaceae bacterium]|nr:transcription antitermination factor NusB [Actinomycetaceae bacterium]
MAKRKFSSRTKARKRAVDVLFEADQKGFGHRGSEILRLLEQRKVLSTAQAPLNDFSVRIITGVAEHIDEIDDQLIRFLHGRNLDRIPAPDRAVLRVATWELLFNDDVDDPVAIHEAITLTEAIGGTDKTPQFVNGVLSSIHDAKKAGHIAIASQE